MPSVCGCFSWDCLQGPIGPQCRAGVYLQAGTLCTREPSLIAAAFLPLQYAINTGELMDGLTICCVCCCA